tara:strand:+ start:772 stop:960 length:189 start_codon:yes stop_codon:yes gene_type:complete
MSYTEDKLYEIFCEVRDLDMKDEFDAQLEKMKLQTKHLHKPILDKWEYALYRIKGGIPQDKY